MRTDLPLFAYEKVRQALTIGLDRQGLINDYYKGNAQLFTWPSQSNCVGVYVPLNQQPADIQNLFKYDPDQAKKILTDAGYPNGFKAKFMIVSSYADIAAIIKEMWKKIGVDIELVTVESSAFSASAIGGKYDDMGITIWGNIGPLSAPGWAYRTGVLWNYSIVKDKYIDDTYAAAVGAPSIDEQNKIIKTMNEYILRKCYYIGMPIQNLTTFWQPWLKGYSGEYLEGRYYNVEVPFFYGWIDQDLKFSMIGQR
jgi:peptide/nickel transport system substrate-binding protein